ncbi:MAG: PD40 domain-containing protein, partial [Ilumatobacteraceae bacterium]|nr:PD40 domain-containing protein [Ilumatobacteraceae bacterium]
MTAATPFHDLDEYIALPRLGGLALSIDGTRLVVSMNALDPKRTRYVTSLWGVDPEGQFPARRLTRSAKGESGAAFLPDGSLLFVSERPDPDGSDDEPVSALWRLPAGGGEAGVLATRPGGVGGVVVASDSGTIVVSSETLPGSITAEDDKRRRSARKDNKVSAILHETYPIRFWDHDLGPDTPRLMVGDAPGDGVETIQLRDLTGHVGTALGTDEVSWSITPDGKTVYAAWSVVERGGSDRLGIIAIDAASGRRVELLSDPEHEYLMPAVSPDGSHLAFVTATRSSTTEPPDAHLGIVDLSDDGTSATKPQLIATDWDR